MLYDTPTGGGVSMGHVISVLQQKGGATKTTTSVNLAMALQELGHNIIIYDMDKEKPDAMYWADNGTALSDYVLPLFESNPKTVIEKARESYDYIIIDTPPQFEAAALKAALVSDLAIIPSAPSSLDMRALESAAECAVMADIPYKFLASRAVKNTNITNNLIEILKNTGDAFKTVVTNSVNITESQAQGHWVGSYRQNSPSHKQYVSLASEVVEHFNVMQQGEANE